MMEVKACTRCGSRNLKIPSQMELEIRLTLAGQYKCSDCGFIGFPIVFDSNEDYAKYVKLKKNV
ncbi:MAG: hypothetical protein B6U97_02275 [Candidatus Altiarchaeales archaeon ex4484_96]|nr:MAG: hypothetical protein B6U97_02275 [Candidatus Altiarchaeales archaeon ex4484_96]